ncbi:MAG: hypothetical protein ACOYJW_07540 [Candidatus Omnitrophota bacterium]
MKFGKARKEGANHPGEENYYRAKDPEGNPRPDLTDIGQKAFLE